MKTNTFTTPTRKFLVESYGNGWAYTVTDQSDGRELFVQDDAAERLQIDTEDFTDEAVLTEYFSYLD